MIFISTALKLIQNWLILKEFSITTVIIFTLLPVKYIAT